MKNKKLLIPMLSFLIVTTNYPKFYAVPPKYQSSTSSELEQAKNMIIDGDKLCVFELCDCLRLILYLSNTYAPDVTQAIQGTDWNNGVRIGQNSFLKKLIGIADTAFTEEVFAFDSNDCFNKQNLNSDFTRSYPNGINETDPCKDKLLGIIKKYIPKEYQKDQTDAIFSMAFAIVNRDEFDTELGKLQTEIVNYFTQKKLNIDLVREQITPKKLNEAASNLPDELASEQNKSLRNFANILEAVHKLNAHLLNINDVFEEPTVFGKIWKGIKATFGLK